MLVDSLRIRWHSHLLKPLKCPTYTFIRSGRHFKPAPTDKTACRLGFLVMVNCRASVDGIYGFGH